MAAVGEATITPDRQRRRGSLAPRRRRLSGALGRTYIERTNGDLIELAGADSADLAPDDILVTETPGGGYGRPLQQ